MGPEFSAAVGAAGTLLKSAAMFKAGQATASQGAAIQRAREFEAAQMDVAAGQERASSQRRAMEEKRRGRLVQSALTARAAASGGSATDPSVLKLSEQIAEETDFRKLAALYEGESAARTLEAGAAARRFGGAEARRAGRIKRSALRGKAFGTLLDLPDEKSFKTLFDMFGE